MISKLAFSGYRSLRDIAIPLMPLNVITGANGSGKSNVYKALRLLADIAQGNIIRSIAGEGGLQSTLWAGPEKFSRSVKKGYHSIEGTVRRDVVSLKLGFSGSEYGYAIDLGLPQVTESIFVKDPKIKIECMWTGETLGRANVFVERKGPAVNIRDTKGSWANVHHTISGFDSMMTHCTDPQQAPEILTLREHMREWRFYDHFRTDRDAPARKPQIGTYTPVLGHDGSNIASAIATIEHIGEAEALQQAIDLAFPGARVHVTGLEGYIEVEMEQRGLLRPLNAAELSDGTLRYLLWVAALLTPRPPGLLVLNEPETSLHPDLLEPLAQLIIQAAERSQVIVVSHAEKLISALTNHADCFAIGLYKELGETHIDIDSSIRPAWKWPKR